MRGLIGHALPDLNYLKAPGLLAQRYQVIRRQMLNLYVIGGCCGTDQRQNQRHIEEICKALAASP